MVETAHIPVRGPACAEAPLADLLHELDDGNAARALVGRVVLLELVAPVLPRAVQPFPKPVRTRDALHLASTEFLRERQPAIRLATYDGRQASVAKVMGISLDDLDADMT